ncbi:MAG TPA: hypothetical protein EYQ27_21805 [Gemmatimonadetes bacterium]|nr:hypothetical protein [Gemmatimonadota bacterium]
MSVQDIDGHSMGGGTSSTDNEFIDVTLDAGTYYVKVFLYSGATQQGNDYSIEVSSGAAPECPTDSFEPNNTEVAAVPVSLGSSPGLMVCEGDDDYYSLSLGAGSMIDVDVTFLDDDGDVDVQLINAAGDVLAYGFSTDDDETLSYSATAAIDVFVRVYLYADAGDFGNSYDMNIALAVP